LVLVTSSTAGEGSSFVAFRAFAFAGNRDFGTAMGFLDGSVGPTVALLDRGAISTCWSKGDGWKVVVGKMARSSSIEDVTFHKEDSANKIR